MGLIIGMTYMYSLNTWNQSGSMLRVAIGPLFVSRSYKYYRRLYETREVPAASAKTPLQPPRPVMVGTFANDCFVTKWGYRLLFLCLAYVACQWLDKIKVRRVGSRALIARGVLILRL